MKAGDLITDHGGEARCRVCHASEDQEAGSLGRKWAQKIVLRGSSPVTHVHQLCLPSLGPPAVATSMRD